VRILKVITPLWPKRLELAPWAFGYMLPWGQWTRDWPDFLWAVPWPPHRDMRWDPGLL
jgi:hypothetical protein